LVVKRHRRRRGQPAQRTLSIDELQGIMERAKPVLREADHEALLQAVRTLTFLTQELQAKGASLERLRRMLFGSPTEKTSQVLDNATSTGGDGSKTGERGQGKDADRPKAPGHGRNGASAYSGAEKIRVPHGKLQGGNGCPQCHKGKVYAMSSPSVLVRITGMAPLAAKVYECEQLRCNLCGEVFKADAPAGVGNEKYDETAPSMIGMLKYGAGMPFHRIEKLQGNMGIPLPRATQWELVERASGLLDPVHQALIDRAAQGELLHNDDTTAKILEYFAGVEPEPDTPGDGKPDERTGVFTSGIVSVTGDHRIGLFFTGRKHAGENLAKVLARRSSALAAPIQMCDALSRNAPGDLVTIMSNCLAHARRRFVEVVNDFPEECRHLLEILREVYKHDAFTRAQGMSPDERLLHHQKNSGPLMASLETWLRDQIEQRKVEPNSGLGEAIGYMRKHWLKLTLFLRIPGAVLDNNICERALKKAILHRKNALFYKTQNGANVGDIFMSLIYTAELNGESPFDYLVALQRHHEAAAASPADWMPWAYRETVARLGKGPAQSAAPDTATP
jgi:transposase